MSTNALPTLPSEGSLSQYFREVWAFPMLDADTEQSLALKLRDHGDVDAAHQLVTSYLRLVCKIAMGYRGYGLPVADLISEGNIGLMKAVKKFDKNAKIDRPLTAELLPGLYAVAMATPNFKSYSNIQS